MSRYTIEVINTLPLELLTRANFAILKSGRDALSRSRLPALKALAPHEAKMVEQITSDKITQAAILRWVLRGLTLEKAFVKVGHDQEQAREFQQKKRVEKLEQLQLADIIGC